MLFLPGCMQKDLIDIYVFADRFSHHSENFKIDTSKFMAQEEQNELSFPIVFNDKFLLTVRINKETSLVTSVSVVYSFEKGRKISDKDFASFKEIAVCSIKSFTNFQDTDEILANLSADKKASLTKNLHNHFEKGFYQFSLVANEVGIYFSAKTERR